MSFQTIFNIQQSMTVNNRRTIGQMYSRSGQITVAQYLTTVPWVFTVVPHNYLYYPQVRDVIQTIDNRDRQLTETITFNNTNLSWFTAYRGDASTTPTTIQINTQPAANATTLVLKTLPTMSSSLPLFRAGDFIMVSGYTYKITADVLRGAGSTVSVTIHRPVIGTPAVNTAVSCGVNCTFTVVAQECPTYTLTPMTNGAFVNWDSPFVFREYIT
jgi:hypothetical protein